MTSIKDFQIISKLGEGAYSSVYKVKRMLDSVEYALKKVKLMNLSDKEKQNALNEVRILASIRHPNIVGYKEVFIEESSNCLCIVMEFVNGGDLYQKIVESQKKGALLSETEIWNIFIQIVKGLKALHDLQILHRDLKSANVFLNKDGTVKLGDMNVSKVAKKGLLYTQTGTPYYASPEVWKDQPYDNKSDMWSLGCVLYEMAALKPPFRAENMEGLYKKVIRGYYPRIPNHFSNDLNAVIRTLLQVAPHLRPSCDKVLQLPMIVKRMEEKLLTDVEDSNNFLLNTIRIPKNIHYLTDRLPKANYAPLKMKKIEKKKFLQTLAGYQDNEDTDSFDETVDHPVRSSLPEIPFHLPKLKENNDDTVEDKKGLYEGKKMLDRNINEISSEKNIINPVYKTKSTVHTKISPLKYRLKPIKNQEESQIEENNKLPSIIINNRAINIDNNSKLAPSIRSNVHEILRNPSNRIKEISKLYRLPKSNIIEKICLNKREKPAARNFSLPLNC